MYLHAAVDDEQALIRRCLDGDPAAFEPLVQRFHRPLYRVAVRLLGDREEARDALQTAFLKAYQSLSTWDPKRRFFSWIYRILVNDCLNTLRSRRPQESLAEVAAASSSDPLEADDTRRRVRQALLRLSPDQRDVVVLRYFAELSYEQVAAALEVPAKTVKSRLFSARQRLSELLTERQG